MCVFPRHVPECRSNFSDGLLCVCIVIFDVVSGKALPADFSIDEQFIGSLEQAHQRCVPCANLSSKPQQGVTAKQGCGSSFLNFLFGFKFLLVCVMNLVQQRAATSHC
jgi:hypothetical protein